MDWCEAQAESYGITLSQYLRHLANNERNRGDAGNGFVLIPAQRKPSPGRGTK